jgi:RNA polymerase sigma-70 factor (ECF subfamily)
MNGPTDTTRTTLLSRVRDPSDHAAWREFDEKYRDLILRYCRRRGLQEMDAADVRQLVMMRLVKSLPEFVYQANRGRFRDYLCRIVRNVIVEHIARPNVRRRVVFNHDRLDQSANPSGGPDELWDQEWADHHYRLAMESVRRTFEPRSVAMFDRLLGGASVESVAAEHAVTPEAVHKVKQRIRDRMQELIADQVREEDSV